MKQWIEAVPAGHKARIRFDNGRTRSKTFPTARDAKAWLRRSLTEVTDGTFILRRSILLNAATAPHMGTATNTTPAPALSGGLEDIGSARCRDRVKPPAPEQRRPGKAVGGRSST